MSKSTKRGDAGKTSTLSMQEISKTSANIELLAEVDILCGCISSYLGLMEEKKASYENFIQENILHELFIMNAYISAIDANFIASSFLLKEQLLSNLENETAKIINKVPKQTRFIQYCSDPFYLSANSCRTQTRLVEIYAWKLYEQNPKPELKNWCQWLNRLSNFWYNTSLLHAFNEKSTGLLVYFTN